MRLYRPPLRLCSMATSQGDRSEVERPGRPQAR